MPTKVSIDTLVVDHAEKDSGRELKQIAALALWLLVSAFVVEAAVLAPVEIPTGDVKINGVFYLAAGKQPHPTVIILHGVPGIEQNLDVQHRLFPTAGVERADAALSRVVG